MVQNSDSLRLLHTMLRVENLETSIRFYTEGLRMKILRRLDFPEGRFTLVFLGYEAEQSGAVIELTHNWDTKSYEHGENYGHIAIGTADIKATCGHLEELGYDIQRKPGLMKFKALQGELSEQIAFVRDPDGFAVELIER